jgi:hypothetical protein
MEDKNRARGVLRTMREKRWVLFIACVVMSALLTVGSTLAWFVASHSVTNRLETPDLPFSFELFDGFERPGSFSPGDTWPKAVSATNTGELPGFVRLMVLAEVTAADGTLLPSGEGVLAYGGLDLYHPADNPDALWADGGDGYYYYLGRVAPGETAAPPLFTAVSLADGLGPAYDGAGMRIDVKVEASGTARQEYRAGWWGSEAPPDAAALLLIDDILQPLAQ